MQWQYGHFKPLVVKKVGKLFTVRQVIPPLFVSVLSLTLLLSIFSATFLFLFFSVLGIYVIANLAFSIKIALKGSLRCLLVLPLAFAIIHFAWGSGYLKGIWDFLLLKKDVKYTRKDLPLTR